MKARAQREGRTVSGLVSLLVRPPARQGVTLDWRSTDELTPWDLGDPPPGTRHCGPCDRWVRGNPCPRCGADTDARLK